jgi:CRISPR-associated protein Cas5/CasD subtype I-E
MAYLDLVCSSTMQAWGRRENFEWSRKSGTTPEKSAVGGIIGRAMGIDRDDTEGQAWLQEQLQEVIVAQNTGSIPMTDDTVAYIGDYMDQGWTAGFQAAGGGVRVGDVRGIRLWKDFVTDRVGNPMVLRIRGTREFLERVYDALLHPVYPPYLGRYCCIPAKCLVTEKGIYDAVSVQNP